MFLQKINQINKAVAIFLLVSLTLVTCAVSPTGRKTITFLSDSQMNKMGVQAFSQIKEKGEVEKNQKINRYVQCIASAILEVVNDPTGVSKWEVVVFRSNQINAFALPGGKIGVYTGIMQVANTPDQLAAIIGHEVAHVIARHGNERTSSSTLLELGTAIISAVSKESPHHKTIMGALGIGSQFGIVLPFSRTHENEADYLGLKYMAKAGFQPQAAVTLWQNMAKASKGQPPEFMSTHPSHGTRISKLQSSMPEAMALYNQAKTEGKNPNCK